MSLFKFLKTFKIRNVLTLACLMVFLVCKSQSNTNGAIVTMQFEAKQPHGPVLNRVDTFLVRNEFVLEPLKVIFSSDEEDLKTGVTREVSSGKRLKWYNLTNYREMIGMSFDIEKEISAKTIETYRVSDGRKRGIMLINEPILNSGFNVSDFTKDKDTIINGTKCLLIKNNKIVTSQLKGHVEDKISQVRILINPSLKSLAFQFISEKIVQEFGGGAIMNAVFVTDAGYKTTIRYTYSPFTSVQTNLFDYYEKLYNRNITLLDGLKKK